MGPVAILSELKIGVPLYMVVSYVGVISICLLPGREQLEGLLCHFSLFSILDTFAIEPF